MSRKTLLEDSIEKRLKEERYVIPKEKKGRRRFDLTWLIIISICISLLISILKLIAYFG